MITSLDSSVIIDILTDDRDWRPASLAALRRARSEGQLVISDFALAEIHPALGDRQISALLQEWELAYVPCCLEASIFAGESFARYLARGGKRGRIVADFLIAAHAHYHADRLLARDEGYRRDYFSAVTIWMASD